jgi:NAD-dependent SIR2 family protein deacetylase
MTPDRDAEASLQTLVCDQCHVPMRFVYTIPRVTEPGRVQMFQCERCDKVILRPESQASAFVG